jgi:hypothetical protein
VLTAWRLLWVLQVPKPLSVGAAVRFGASTRSYSLLGVERVAPAAGGAS